jgi:hypothetical protein
MEYASGNIYIRENPMPKAGMVCHGHKHNFDHTTVLFAGAVHVSAVLPDGRKIEQDFHAPSHFLVHKDVEHEITALVDDTVFWCVYSHRTPQGDVVEHVTGWREAYV